MATATKPTYLDRFFVSAFTLDDDGVAHFDAKKFVADADAYLPIVAVLDHAFTSDDTPVTYTLASLAAPDLYAVDGVVTVRNAAGTKRGRWSLSELAYRVGGSPAFEDGTGEDASPKSNDAGLEAKLDFDGNDLVLSLTGLAATDLTWGFEFRLQRQLT